MGISQTRWVSTTTTTKVSTTPSQLRALKLQLLLLLLLDLVDSLLTDKDSTTISRENLSKVSTTTDLTARPLSPPRGKNEDAKRALDAAEKEATKKVSIFAVKNKQSPNQVQNRILGHIAGERLAYEACEIYMNETAPNDLSADEIRAEIFEVVKKAITADE